MSGVRLRRYRFQLRLDGEEEGGPVVIARGETEEKARERAAAYYRRVWWHKLEGAGGYTIERIPDRAPRERRF